MKNFCCITCSFFLLAGSLSLASAADPKVVVIPLNKAKKVLIDGDHNLNGTLTNTFTYLISSKKVVMRGDGQCLVTISGSVFDLDSTDSVQGPYFRTSRQIGTALPSQDGSTAYYQIRVAGSDVSTTSSASYTYDMDGGVTYKFGCAFLNRPASWADDTGYCRVDWICTGN